MLNSERLLSYEVFLSELPPCFTTNDLADKYIVNGQDLANAPPKPRRLFCVVRSEDRTRR